MSSGKNCLVAVCLLYTVLGCDLQQTTLKPDVSFEIYTVVAKPAAETLSLIHEADGKTFILQTPPIATEKDVITTTLKPHSDTGDLLSVKLTEAAGRRMMAATSVKGGQLAVVIEGKIFSVATIHASVRTDFALTGEFTQEKIDRWFATEI